MHVLMYYILVVTVAPETVIYDNACNLHNYALNRDPVFFKDTHFLVDRFHWDNHTCKYALDMYMCAMTVPFTVSAIDEYGILELHFALFADFSMQQWVQCQHLPTVCLDQ